MALSLRQRLAQSFSSRSGVGTMRAGHVVSSRTRSPRGVNQRQTNALMRQFQQEQARRNAQIQAQMKQQQAMQKKLMAQARQHAKQMGAARRQDIRETAVKQEGMAKQSLISRGLGNTTIQESVSRGIQSDASRAMTQQRDLEAGRISGLYAQEAGMQLPQTNLMMSGINMQSGGLMDYIKLLQMLGGGLS